MGKGFLDCVKNKGKVSTKKLPNGKFMRLCVLDGKTFAGEVMKSKESDKTDIKEEDKGVEILEELSDQSFWINESQSISVLEKTEDGKLMIEVDVVEAGVSGNNRRYFMKDIKAQKIVGKKVFMDHKYEARNAVGKIKEQYMANSRKLSAKLWIKNSAMHPDIEEMVEDGRVDAVSIGGKGDIKRVKEKGKIVDEIHNLQIKELSFVGIGGIKSAKVKSIGG